MRFGVPDQAAARSRHKACAHMPMKPYILEAASLLCGNTGGPVLVHHSFIWLRLQLTLLGLLLAWAQWEASQPPSSGAVSAWLTDYSLLVLAGGWAVGCWLVLLFVPAVCMSAQGQHCYKPTAHACCSSRPLHTTDHFQKPYRVHNGGTFLIEWQPEGIV
jgi:hypothetical protein